MSINQGVRLLSPGILNLGVIILKNTLTLLTVHLLNHYHNFENRPNTQFLNFCQILARL